jgi:DNA-binding LytR/AlgR family response regulator
VITCIAIDDEPLALELISTYCSQVSFLDLKKTFLRPSEAVAYLNKFPVDLLFLDIQMPDISGIDFYKSLKTDKPVIFITAYSEYAIEGFTLNAADYLLKPIRFARFEKAVIKAKEYIEFLRSRNNGISGYLFVRSEYRLMKIAHFEIRYIQGLDNYIRIFTDQGRPVMSKMTLKEVTEKLPDTIFRRIHRSFIINIHKCVSYSNRKVTVGRTLLPVGISYESDVKKVFGL